jgi:phenylpyruvate tautomerase PptA (4-oxalocrotonate tautomerase family)
MATEEMGKLLNQIGQLVAKTLGKVPDDVFVFIKECT